MLEKFVFVVVTADIGIGLIIFFFTGMAGKPTNVYPMWVWELLFSYYWFYYLFTSMNKKYFDVTQNRTFVWDLKPYVAWLYIIHLISAYALTFGLLPAFEFSMSERIPIAYLGSYFVTFAIPMQAALWLYPRYLKKLESERIDPKKIQAIASRCEEARKFMKTFPHVRFNIADNAFKNQTAQCFFWHRQPRRELEGLFEDVVLGIPVEMSGGKVLRERITTERYIHRETEGKSAVYHLPVDRVIDRNTEETELDADALEKFGALFDRFPSLKDAPFPLAVREPEKEIV